MNRVKYEPWIGTLAPPLQSEAAVRGESSSIHYVFATYWSAPAPVMLLTGDEEACIARQMTPPMELRRSDPDSIPSLFTPFARTFHHSITVHAIAYFGSIISLQIAFEAFIYIYFGILRNILDIPHIFVFSAYDLAILE